MFTFSFSSLSALESQIILINSEAYLVDLNDNYDVVRVHERIPEYFQDHSSHEKILATYISNIPNNDIGCETMIDYGFDITTIPQTDMFEKNISCLSTVEKNFDQYITVTFNMVYFTRSQTKSMALIQPLWKKISMNRYLEKYDSFYLTSKIFPDQVV